jgi:hypothetical protein
MMNSKFRMVAIATAALALSSAPVLAASINAGGNAGVSASTPGHQMQTNGSVNGQAGASGYAPGHLKAQTGVKGSARTYAPGHRTTTGAGVHGEGKAKIH